jgi:PAS domain S-box-containing protein
MMRAQERMIPFMMNVALRWQRRHPDLPFHLGSLVWTVLVVAACGLARPSLAQGDLLVGISNRNLAAGLALVWLFGLLACQLAAALARRSQRDRNRLFTDLQQQVERYRNVIDYSPDGFWLVSEQGLLIDVNDVYVRRSGFSREEILGRHIREFEARETNEEITERMARIRKDGGAVYDILHRAKDGSCWPMEAKVTFSPGCGGRYAAFFRDLSLLQRSEILTHIRDQLTDRLPSDSLPQLLEASISQAKLWTGSPQGYFHFLDPGQVYLTLQTGDVGRRGTPDEPQSSERSTRINAFSNWAESLRTGQPVMRNALNPGSGGVSPGDRSIPGHRELVIPIRQGTQVIALFGVGGKTKDYLPADADWVTDIGAMTLDLARRKRANSELTQFFQLVPDLVCIITATGQMHRLNPEWERVLGCTLAKLQSTPFIDRVHPDDRLPTLRRFVQLGRGGNLQRFVNRCQAEDGSYRWIEWNAASMPQEQLIYAAASDVTDRVRNDRLGQLQRDLGLALSSSRNQEPNALFQLCTDAVIEATGMDCGGLYLKDSSNGSLRMVAHKGLSEAFVQAVTEMPADSPKTALVNQGAILYTRYTDLPASTAAQQDEGLIAIGIASIGHDGEILGCLNVASHTIETVPVWARKSLEALLPQIGNVIVRFRAEQALRESEERFRLLFEQANDAIFWAEADSGRLLHCNQAAERLLGRPRAEIIGHPNTTIHPPEHTQRYQEVFRAHALGIGKGPIEAEVLRSDGTRRIVIISPAVIDFHGQNIVQGIFHDITAAREMEVQFRHAQKMEAVGQLAGGVAHDFNNILGAMMMNLHLVREDASPDPEVQTTLRELEEEARRGAELTRRLLLLGRREVVQIRRLNLNDVIEGLFKMLHRLLGEHIELVYEPSAQPAWIDADSGMMEQVLMNLCVNARDAMPQGGPLRIVTSHLEITPEIASRTVNARVGSFHCLAVIDAGTGIPPEIQERVFEPFFTTKAPGNGTGLGLATVYSIVRQHQGWITLDSLPGTGTTFLVYLPAATPAPDVASTTDTAGLPQGNETLLLVEDDPSLLRTASLLLRTCGYRVLEARNGPEALQIWQESESQIQLLFTDIVMPGGLSGIELAKKLRQSKPALKILMTTGYSADLVNSGGLSDKTIKLLPKPYTPANLAQTLRHCLDEA